MKKTIQNVKILLFLCSFNCALMFAQDQRNGISYQALIINSSEVELPGANQKNTPLRNQNICLQFSLIDEMGNYEYIEHTTTTTDSNGMVNVVIGTQYRLHFDPYILYLAIIKLKWGETR